MQHMRNHSDSNLLLLCACDTPFLPKDLSAQLLENLPQKGASFIRYQDRLQPTFSLWHRDLFEEIEQAVTEKDIRGFKPFIKELGSRAAMVDYPNNSAEKINPFFNINTEQDLLLAQELLNNVQ
jgi:molybdopterin-guanine dinucleotide biosynthesis protein A